MDRSARTRRDGDLVRDPRRALIVAAALLAGFILLAVVVASDAASPPLPAGSRRRLAAPGPRLARLGPAAGRALRTPRVRRRDGRAADRGGPVARRSATPMGPRGLAPRLAPRRPADLRAEARDRAGSAHPDRPLEPVHLVPERSREDRGTGRDRTRPDRHQPMARAAARLRARGHLDRADGSLTNGRGPSLALRRSGGIAARRGLCGGRGGDDAAGSRPRAAGATGDTSDDTRSARSAGLAWSHARATRDHSVRAGDRPRDTRPRVHRIQRGCGIDARDDHALGATLPDEVPSPEQPDENPRDPDTGQDPANLRPEELRPGRVRREHVGPYGARRANGEPGLRHGGRPAHPAHQGDHGHRRHEEDRRGANDRDPRPGLRRRTAQRAGDRLPGRGRGWQRLVPGLLHGGLRRGPVPQRRRCVARRRERRRGRPVVPR